VKDSAWWDRVWTVENMAQEDGRERPYMDSNSPCRECGSEFMQHRCHMEEYGR
jgi:hypothetical protein